MTDSIDLDDIDEQRDDGDDGSDRNPGDWFWRGDGDPDDEPSPEPVAETADADASGTDAPSGAATTLDSRIPRVPRETDGKPAGIPKESGGAGGASHGKPAAPPESDSEPAEASGPHGRDADDMTLALTYRAAKRLESPVAVYADATQWADWVGIVGDVPVHAINKFQRDQAVDLDFFNGAGTRPTERLAEIDPSSMFYADRMVVIGLSDEEGIEPDNWEFLPLPKAAEKAGWELNQ